MKKYCKLTTLRSKNGINVHVYIKIIIKIKILRIKKTGDGVVGAIIMP
jgi:hypothetical protein